MTPLKNHGPHFDAANMTPKEHAKALHDKGIEYHTACVLAGYDEMTEIRRSFLRWLAFMAVSAICSVIILLSLPAEADETESSVRNEAMFAQCLSGVTVQAGDRLFQCLPAGVAK